MHDTLNAILTVLLLVAVLAAYWLPTIVAIYRKMPNLGSTVVVNAFLGWTGIGWIVALAMSLGRSTTIA